MLDNCFPENSSDAQKLFFWENNGNYDQGKAFEEIEVLEYLDNVFLKWLYFVACESRRNWYFDIRVKLLNSIETGSSTTFEISSTFRVWENSTWYFFGKSNFSAAAFRGKF